MLYIIAANRSFVLYDSSGSRAEINQLLKGFQRIWKATRSGGLEEIRLFCLICVIAKPAQIMDGFLQFGTKIQLHFSSEIKTAMHGKYMRSCLLY